MIAFERSIPGSGAGAFDGDASIQTGTAGDDSLTVSPGTAGLLDGLAGNDTLTGADLADVLVGGDGDDTIVGGAGVDEAAWSTPRRANAVIIQQEGDSSVSGPEGSDIIRGIETYTYLDGRYVTDSGDTAAEVLRLYGAALGRDPDAGGLQSWKTGLDTGATTLVETAAGFTRSPEFQERYGALSDTDFISLLYRNVLDREGEQSGIDAWAGELANGISRAEVLVGFSESPENVERLSPRVEQGIWVLDETATAIARLYDTLLDRRPDADGLERWMGAFKLGMTLREAAAELIGSSEFQEKYGTLSDETFIRMLYLNTFGQELGHGGFEGWIGLPDRSLSRPDLAVGFSESQEHRAALAPYTDDGVWLA